METLIQMILFFALLLSLMIVISLLGKRFREQYEAKRRLLSDEEKGIEWLNINGSATPVDKEGGFIRLDELLSR